MNDNRNQTVMISYDCASGRYSALAGQKGLAFCQALLQGEPAVQELDSQVKALAAQGEPQACYRKLHFQGNDFHAGIFCVGNTAPIGISLTLANTLESFRDPLTGLLTSEYFAQQVEALLRSHPQEAAAGGFAMIYIDLHQFKAINDLFGRKKGDALLRHIAQLLDEYLEAPAMCCRLASDHFAVFCPTADKQPEKLLEALSKALQTFDMPIECTFHAGIYRTTETALSANTMIDRATLAQSTIKGNYNIRYVYYNPDMRKALLGEQEIVGMMANALAEKQFVLYYQPQYNHSTGMLVGAEALVRWQHPENGLIPPGVFIPIFERNGFITNLDLYVFEEACVFLRRCMEQGWSIVPISVNFSRYDVFQPNFVDRLEQIRNQYEIPTKYLRVELTESVMVGGPEYISDIIGKLHSHGYVVEMDDFGSGYSSLNVLKDMDLDIIKLDMRFLERDSGAKRGGTILSSVVRMAKWLSIPVIAEGVETVEQADFLRSIGCDYMQGYLYSKPLTEADYVALVSASRIGATVPQMRLIETMNAFDFWDPSSQETLIFSNYVGAAAIFDYHDGKVEILRVNKKYLQELGMNLSERDLIESDPWLVMDAENREIYRDMLSRAIATMDEQECETWRTIFSSCCGEERFCIRSTVRVIGVSGDRYLLHAMIRNITAERLYYDAMKDSERRFKMASEQVNIYYWEYTVATREMRPCFRCMRDLGLPPLLTNYPDSAIEAGIFPPEVADMYRDWHRQIETGVPSLEAVIPLTEGRVPFRVRYTTEFDENGHAVKAYGSAALVV